MDGRLAGLTVMLAIGEKQPLVVFLLKMVDFF
jgi:hypothetical protein